MTHSGQSRTEEEQDGQTGAQREWHRMSAEQSLIGRVMKSWVRVCMCVFQSAHAYVCALRSVHDYVHLFACQLCQITWVRTEHGHKRTRVYRAASHLFIFTAMTHIQQTFKSYYRLRGLHQAESLDSIFINICPTWETWYDSDLGWWSSAAEKYEEGWLNLQPNWITVLYASTNGTFYLILDKRVPYKKEGHTFYLTTISFLFFFFLIVLSPLFSFHWLRIRMVFCGQLLSRLLWTISHETQRNTHSHRVCWCWHQL